MFGSLYRSATNLAESVESVTLAGRISATVLVGVANDWKEDREFERSALASTRKAALNKMIAEKKKLLSSK